MEDATQGFLAQENAARELFAQEIANNLVGGSSLIDGPFQPHRQTYADYAASGKAVKFIEDYIDHEVLPVYSNTHTSSSFVGIQSSCFREEARGIVRDTVFSCFSCFTRSTTVQTMMSFFLLEMDAQGQSMRSFAF